MHTVMLLADRLSIPALSTLSLLAQQTLHRHALYGSQETDVLVCVQGKRMIGEDDLRVYLDKFDKKYWATYKVLDILQKVFYRSVAFLTMLPYQVQHSTPS